MSFRTAYPTFSRFAAWLSPFRWWTWRTTRRLLSAFLVLVTLLGLAYAVENWRGRRAFAAVAREAAAAGLSFNSRDYAPRPVPEGQNLAKHPLFDPPQGKDAQERFWENMKNQFQLRPAQGGGARELFEFPAPDPHRNSLAEGDAIWSELQSRAGIDGAGVVDYLQRIAPLLDTLNTAAAERPYLRYDYEWENFYTTPLRHLSALRRIAKAASLQALVDLEARRPAPAARVLQIPFRLSSALTDEPCLISQLTSSALASPAIGDLWQGQFRHQWTADELSLFSKLLADDRILLGYHRAFSAECAAGVSLCLQFAGRPSPAKAGILDDGTTHNLAQIFVWGPSGWAFQNAANVGRNTLRNHTLDPASGRVFAQKPVRRDGQAKFLMPYEMIANILAPSLDGIVLAAGQAKTSHDLARLAVSLEQYLLEHGDYPDSLARILAADPALAALHDPFTGEAYRYRRDADGGFTLWGVGSNSRDDGAAFLPEKRPRNPYETPADLVWRVPGRAS